MLKLVEGGSALEGSGRIVSRWFGLFLLIGAVWFGLWAAARGWPGPIVASDVQQHRLNVALPIPQPNQPIRQTFRPGWNGLSEVEILVARYGEGGTGQLTLRLLADSGRDVASQSWSNQQLSHNQTLVLRFAPQPDSAGRQYTLVISGDQANQFSAWAYDLDVYDGGQMLVPAGGNFQELRFTTRYTLSWATALMALKSRLEQDGGVMFLAMAYIFLPGAFVLSFWGARWPGRSNPVVWWGLALAIGLALWPLGWYWLTLLSGRWVGWSLWLVVGGGWLAVGWRQWRLGWRLAPAGEWLPMLVILLVSLAVRLLAVRHLAFPAWVDSGRHALISQLMADTGQTLSHYRPLLPVDRSPYHVGLHTIPAGLKLMNGYALPALLLVLGQLLNALAPLTIYTSAWLFTKRRGVALLAAFLVALPFFFPAYYTTWGRLTQLDGALVLAVLVALTWRVGCSGRNWAKWTVLVGLLAAGLFLIHFRVFVLYLPWAGLVALFSNRSRFWRLLAAGGLALLLIAPRVFTLYQLTRLNQLTTSDSGYTAFPFSYVQTGWEPYFWWVAGAIWLLAIGAWFGQRQRWAVLPLLLMAWMGLVVVGLSGRVPGLPPTWVVNLNSAYITFFVPLAWLVGIGSGRVRAWLARRGWLPQLLTYGVAGAGLMALALFGVKQQITILNPITILAEPQDLAAIAWAADQLPPSAKVAVNSWLWLGQTWAGGDGGGWLLTLTGREITTPPVDYIYNRELAEQVANFNQQATAMTDWASPAAAEWLAEQGITHVFVGARGGFFDPAALANNPNLEMIYGQNGVFIFALPGQ